MPQCTCYTGADLALLMVRRFAPSSKMRSGWWEASRHQLQPLMMARKENERKLKDRAEDEREKGRRASQCAGRVGGGGGMK